MSEPPGGRPGATLVELIGSTSAGKTTLAARMRAVAARRGIDARDGDSLVLRQVGAGALAGTFAGRRLAEALAGLRALAARRRYAAYLGLVREAARLAPGGPAYRASIARIARHKVGVREAARRLAPPGSLLLVDNEGLLQAPHTLFVHALPGGAAFDPSAFLEAVPLPDVVLYVREWPEVLIERTLRRGHRRVGPREVERFVREAHAVFETLAGRPELASRLVVAEAGQATVAGGGGAPEVVRVRDLAHEALHARDLD